VSRVGAVVVAAGRGERLGGRRPKALVEVGGVPLVTRAVSGLRAAGIGDVVVVHPPGAADEVAAALFDLSEVVLVPGGARRTDSVRAGVTALPAAVSVVAVHDAARALQPPAVIARTVAAVVDDVLAAAPAVPVADTLKAVDGDDVVGTVDRAGLVAVQTPQVFPRQVLTDSLDGGDEATDDLALVERRLAAGELTGRVVHVAGSARGFKVTYPDDVIVATALLEAATTA
jgi:2-C-methyl-D-erythritol 4-phosphate cytidylyltransferase